MPDSSHPWKIIKTGADNARRIAQACDRCRTKKIKCDGLEPCTPCRQVGFDCKTSDKLSRRAFPRGYTESLEEQVRVLEAELKQIKSELVKKNRQISQLLLGIDDTFSPSLSPSEYGQEQGIEPIVQMHDQPDGIQSFVPIEIKQPSRTITDYGNLPILQESPASMQIQARNSWRATYKQLDTKEHGFSVTFPEVGELSVGDDVQKLKFIYTGLADFFCNDYSQPNYAVETETEESTFSVPPIS